MLSKKIVVLIPLILIFPPLFTPRVNAISFWGIVKSGDITDEFYGPPYASANAFCENSRTHAGYSMNIVEVLAFCKSRRTLFDGIARAQVVADSANTGSNSYGYIVPPSTETFKARVVFRLAGLAESGGSLELTVGIHSVYGQSAARTITYTGSFNNVLITIETPTLTVGDTVLHVAVIVNAIARDDWGGTANTDFSDGANQIVVESYSILQWFEGIT